MNQNHKVGQDLRGVGNIPRSTKKRKWRFGAVIAVFWLPISTWANPCLRERLKQRLDFISSLQNISPSSKKNQQALADETMPVDKKPDIDNYEKALYDSMSEIVFKDDGQIALHDVGKFYSLNPRIEVEIVEMRT